MNLLELSEQEIIRRNSMEQLRQMGIEPYPAAEYVTNAFSKEIKENFKDDAEPRPVSIAGRIMSRRIMGKASFMELQDSEGRIQVYISRDDICPEENKDLYNIVFKKLLDIGDFVGIKGNHRGFRREKLRRKAVLRIAFISITAVDDNTVLICIKYRL